MEYSFNNVKKIIRQCAKNSEECKKKNAPKLKGCLKVKQTEHQFECIQIDLTEIPDIKIESQYRYLMNCVDLFCRKLMSIPLTNKLKEETLRGLFMFQCLDISEKVQTDKGKEFLNEAIKKTLKDFSTKEAHGRPYNPQAQGCVERANQTIKKLIRMLAFEFPNESFDYIFNRALVKYNTLYHRAIGTTANKMFRYGNDEKTLNIREKYSKEILNNNKGNVEINDVVWIKDFRKKGNRFEEFEEKDYLLAKIIKIISSEFA